MGRTRPDFLVVSLHPAIDRTIEVPSLRPVPLIRGRLLRVEAGGKAINVAHTLSNLGHHLAVAGFLGRWDAPFFAASFDRRRVHDRFILVESITRESVTLVEKQGGREVHIVSGGLAVTRADAARLGRVVEGLAPPEGYAVFSGSRPKGIGISDYTRLLRICRERGARLVVDSSGDMLRAALRARPWLIKPNHDELSELAGRPLRGLPRVLCAARTLLDKCPNILVTLGRDGALLVTADGAWHAWEPRPPRSAITVGCGDSLLAGFLSAHSSGASLPESLRFALSCGSACARSDYACIRDPREPARFLRRIRLIHL